MRTKLSWGPWHVALIAWTCFIWVHSLLPGDASSSESGFFLTLIQPLFEEMGLRDAEMMHLIVRKGGHFCEYLVLGMLSHQALRQHQSNDQLWLIPLFILWVGVPCADEIIQLYTPDRKGTLTDVLLDMSGYTVGVMLAVFLHNLIRKQRNTLSDRGM